MRLVMQPRCAVQSDAVPWDRSRASIIENSACGLLFRTRMSRPMGLRLVRGQARGILALPLVAAFLCALTVASSPRLHEQLHRVDRHHECAATLLARGNCEHAAAPRLTPTIENGPVALAFLSTRWELATAATPSSILEHAPPAE